MSGAKLLALLPALLVSAALTEPCQGQDIPVADITALRCKFPQSVFADFNGARFTTSPGKGFGDELLVFSELQPARNAAKIVGNAGTGDLTLLVGMGVLNFVEQTPSGNLIATTVFLDHRANPKQPKYELPRNRYLAVMSRHLGSGIGPPPIVSQNYGTCDAVGR